MLMIAHISIQLTHALRRAEMLLKTSAQNYIKLFMYGLCNRFVIISLVVVGHDIEQVRHSPPSVMLPTTCTHIFTGCCCYCCWIIFIYLHMLCCQKMFVCIVHAMLAEHLQGRQQNHSVGSSEASHRDVETEWVGRMVRFSNKSKTVLHKTSTNKNYFFDFMQKYKMAR